MTKDVYNAIKDTSFTIKDTYNAAKDISFTTKDISFMAGN